jgi:hypothetical protein
MDRGEFSPALGVPLRKFNGYLFKDRTAIPLDAEELEVLIQAAEHRWTEVEPAIFGTLLERALNPKERAKLGAHYTPRVYVERLVGPTIIEPLRADWAGVRVAASELIDQGKADEARRTVETFHTRLAQTRVLDPACGTGNFLYVAMARMKELEGEVLDLLVDLGDDQYLAELTGHTITPENFLGIEINPRAAAIAQLVLWIGYLQWHFRVNGADRAPPEPILRDIRTIENRDALIEWDERVLERDTSGAVVTRWDGETMRPHPVTGKPVPDEAARVQVYRYVNPRAAKWPKADFIVGNPPFIGNKRMREKLGGNYVEDLRASYAKLPSTVDLVMYWWSKAADALRHAKLYQFGLITTNSITQVLNRGLVHAQIEGRPPISIVFAVPDHPWRDPETDAAVRVSLTVVTSGRHEGTVWRLPTSGELDETKSLILIKRGRITSDLSADFDVQSVPLLSNQNLCLQGCKLVGSGFELEEHDYQRLNRSQTDASHFLPEYIAGMDINRRQRTRHVIDFYGLSEKDAEESFPGGMQHLRITVKPERDLNRRDTRRLNWWLFGENAPKLRRAQQGLTRWIATSEVSKNRFFVFVKYPGTLADGSLAAIALDDAYFLGILSSRQHVVWALRFGGRLEDRPRYQNGPCFDPFPFPADVSEALRARIRAKAEALDAVRKRVLAEHTDLTLTKLYNVLEALDEGRALTAAERDIHDRGLVTLIRQHHDVIDEGVADAYGWGDEHRAGTLNEETILARLVALNKERAAEEARGLVRYLRPEFQDPGYRAPVATTFDLGEAAVASISNLIPWPATLPEQVGAVQSILAAAPAPLGASDIARSFKGKRAATVRPVLDALAGLGMARRLNDGRYAA